MVKFCRTTLITVLCLSVITGVALARKFNLGNPYWLLIALPLLMHLRKKNLISLIVIVAAGLAFGLWRGGMYMVNVRYLDNLIGRRITISAKATNEAVYGRSSQIEFTADDVRVGGGRKLAGSIKISGFGVPMVYRGDTVRASGKIYPARGSSQARMSYAELERLSEDKSPVNRLTRRFDAGIQNALPEPASSFSLGLLIGQRNSLPNDLTAALTAVGLVHIVAVSGYNLTILVRAVGRFKLGSKYQKLLASLALITVFVLVTGFSASIVRAAVVSGLSLWAWYYGRRLNPLVLLSFAAALTALWNPYYVWGDLGWYLSFLAFFGVLVIAPFTAAKMFKNPPKLLGMVVLETLAAEVMTMPLILMTFSQLSLVALAANALIVPLVPLAMLLSAIAGAGGMLWPQFAGWLAFPARWVLTFMLDAIRALSNIPSALVHRSISLASMLVVYAIVLAAVTIGYKKLPHSRRQITDEATGITP